jgi:SAM-dependent MidA family methyltransferase
VRPRESKVALAHAALQSHPPIARALARDGRITFARYMQLALYHPRWGYYSRRDAVGETGDFYTSPELHPLFAATVAARAEALWRAMGAPPEFDFVEVGGGSGRFARDFLLYVDQRFGDLSPALRYRIDDRGAGPRRRQLERLIRAGLDRRVRWTDGSWAAWSKSSVRGMVVANELLDALSVHLVTAREGRLQELYVSSSADGPRLEAGPPSTPELARYFHAHAVHIPDGVRWEVNLNARRWIRRGSGALAAGGLLLIDYGYPAAELYSERRPGGTLLCYAAHTLHSDPLRNPGEQDMTSHIDLTAARSTLAASGMALLEDRSQSDALDPAATSDWRNWTLSADLPWVKRSGLVRSLEALSDRHGLGRLRWLLGTKNLDREMFMQATPIPTTYRSLDDHLVLPDPAGLDPMADIEEQWRELWDDDKGDAETDTGQP